MDLTNISIMQPDKITPIQTYQPVITECNMYYLEILNKYFYFMFILIFLIIIFEYMMRQDLSIILVYIQSIISLFMISYILNSFWYAVLIFPLMFLLLIELVETVKNKKNKV